MENSWEKGVLRAAEVNTTHGLSNSPEYKIWIAMKSRCNNPKNPRYSKYGGRGITVCKEWEESFQNFINDVGFRPSSDHSIDRIDNDQGYSPSNCKWSTPHEQMTNRTITRYVLVDGEEIPLATLAKQYQIPANTLRFRILKGWTLHDALNQPVRRKMPNGFGRWRDYKKT